MVVGVILAERTPNPAIVVVICRAVSGRGDRRADGALEPSTVLGDLRQVVSVPGLRVQLLKGIGIVFNGAAPLVVAGRLKGKHSAVLLVVLREAKLEVGGEDIPAGVGEWVHLVNPLSPIPCAAGIHVCQRKADSL